jgi:8-oxo-dGTP diphosphatase
MTNHPDRRASRLIVIDSQGRILLFRHVWETGETFWAPPGGGLETGETFEQAALREASEELGITPFSVTFLWENMTDFLYLGRRIHQRERYFQAAADLRNLLRDVEEIHRKEGILEVKWWTLADLESTQDVVFPARLAHRLRELANR